MRGGSFNSLLDPAYVTGLETTKSEEVGVIEAELFPLQYPDVWPPPDLAPCPPHRFQRVPIVRWVVGCFIRLRRWSQHLEMVLEPIADQIKEQLEARPVVGFWPESTSQQQIAEIISEAVCLEKGLKKPPVRHPKDPFPLLFWGPYDDLTPLIVNMELNDKLGLKIPMDFFLVAWKEEWTVQQFVQECDLLRSLAIASDGWHRVRQCWRAISP